MGDAGITVHVKEVEIISRNGTINQVSNFHWLLQHQVLALIKSTNIIWHIKWLYIGPWFNPSNAEATSVQGCKAFCKPPKPCRVGIHWIALSAYFQMSTHVQGFSHFTGLLYHFVMTEIRPQLHKGLQFLTYPCI